MNAYLDKLGPYPIQRLGELAARTVASQTWPAINLSIGEPRHRLPEALVQALAANASSIGAYPNFAGSRTLRRTIADWVGRRFAPAVLDPDREIVVVNGSREGLFSMALALLDATRSDSYVVCPNPGYAVYDGTAVLSGLKRHSINTDSLDRTGQAYTQVPAEVWEKAQLLYLCSPDNPTGAVLTLEAWRTLFELSDRYGFVIAADECYSEIYFDEASPPIGALQAAARLGRGYHRLLAFSSLSKRSNAPGLRSGFIAGDAGLLARIEKYRSYNGGGMNQAVQAASAAAWSDEAHVVENRLEYRRKLDQVVPVLQQAIAVDRPQAGFFVWADIRSSGLDDEAFTRGLYEEFNVLVLPGSYLTHEVDGVDPGYGRVRIALVPSLEECLEGARRIAEYARIRAATS